MFTEICDKKQALYEIDVNTLGLKFILTSELFQTKEYWAINSEVWDFIIAMTNLSYSVLSLTFLFCAV